MIVARTISDVRAALADRRTGRIGLVPTMGALHEGHRALLDTARATCDTAAMSLFVNPAQFGESADLNGYQIGGWNGCPPPPIPAARRLMTSR